VFYRANQPLTGEQVLQATARASLWRQPSFLRLWTSETISSFGAQFTELAIPFTAVLVLQASPSQLGFLTATITAPFLIFSLFAGVWVDRHKRRQVMILSNIGRAALLALVPLAVLSHILSLYLLFAVAFFVGTLRVFFEIAYQSFLPSIVKRDELVEANSRLEASRAVSSVAGPGAAGLLIQLLSAPFAVGMDIASFISSTVILRRIKHEEFVEARTDRAPSMIYEAREGLMVVVRDPRLRQLAGAGATANFFEFAIQAIFILYAVDILGFQAEQLGIILSIGAIGAIVGALIAGKLSDRIGIGPAIITSLTIGASVWGPLIYFATPATAPVFLVVAWFCGELSFVSYSINQSSFRQAICPAQLQGRVNATLRFIAAGMVPLGSITGGLLGEFLGLRVAIGIASIGILIAPILLVFSPVRQLKRVSERDLLTNL
jgi:MFS family permease